MSTLKLRYVGDQKRGQVVPVDGVDHHVKHRGEVELPVDVAKNLLRNQPDAWHEVTPKGQKDEEA